jgi:hypothetical protein
MEASGENSGFILLMDGKMWAFKMVAKCGFFVEDQ